MLYPWYPGAPGYPPGAPGAELLKPPPIAPGPVNIKVGWVSATIEAKLSTERNSIRPF